MTEVAKSVENTVALHSHQYGDPGNKDASPLLILHGLFGCASRSALWLFLMAAFRFRFATRAVYRKSRPIAYTCAMTEVAKSVENTVALHSHQYGDPGNKDASPLLILHGLFGCAANWRSIAKLLSTSRQVFCLDLRNHGRSPWHERMDYPAMAADVARFIADRQLQLPALLGHSMGGKIAMMLAQNGADEWSKLMVVDIAPVPYAPHRHVALIEAMQSLDLTAADRRQIDAALAKQIPEPATRQFLAQNLTREQGADDYRWRLNLASIRRNIENLSGYENEQVATLDALFIAGADSDYLRPAAHAAVSARFPRARIETMQNAGHWLHAQHPARLVSLCRAFLAD